MYTVGRYISQGVYTVAGPFHPFGGAVDIIVVEQEDGTFKSTPWYVKFGKFQGVLKRREKVVDVAVNGNDVNFHMYLDATGEAYFLKDADSDTEVSILSPPSAASSGDDIVVETLAVEAVKPDYNVQAKVEIQESQEAAEKPCSRENLARRSILGIVFRGYGRERPLAGPDCALERVSSLQTAEIVSDLLDNSWGYGSGGKGGQGTANNSQAPAVSSSLNSQHMAAVSNSKSKTSDSQTSFTAETMGPEEEPVINERTDVPANKYSTLSSSLHLQGGEGSRTEAADNCGNSGLSEPSSTDADCATTADCPSFVGVELSLCGHLLKEHMGMEEAAEAFTSARVSLHEFKNSSASIMANDKLIIRVGGQYYPWNVAAQIVLGILAFGQVIMPVTDSAISVERPEPVAKSQAVGTLVPTATGGWKLWPFPLRRPKTPEQGIAANSLASRDAFLETAGTAVQSPFVNNSHLQNGYYERPRKNKVRTIIPTSEMLAQMNLKEGSNRITFTFFTRMLGKQQVDAKVYLWKWNTRIVISDVDGTITKSDVLGQVMPLVGKDWTQSGVARLFSSIKENGYELLFLSARAISQADLTRQFLFSVKQDGETLPNGPVVISPDGLFPSLYREVIRRTPHEFKIACLQDIRSLFPEDCNPFYAGFGNRDTDEISYLKVGIPKGKIFIINPRGEVAVNNRVDVRTYTSLHKLVNDMFPAQTYVEQEDYNLWNFWKLPLPDIEDELKSVSASSSKRS
ncbi:unnamed protein product [Sphagnum jensenii]|uniref:phosphatidate phosphatase n=1 Tax=Sphagnum jensenii TaxID=128206 RepID=A0ABP1BFY6_9BRYO